CTYLGRKRIRILIYNKRIVLFYHLIMKVNLWFCMKRLSYKSRLLQPTSFQIVACSKMAMETFVIIALRDYAKPCITFQQKNTGPSHLTLNNITSKSIS